MANIDIEKKGGIPWWVWLLGALLLGGLIWWALSEAGDNRTAEIVGVKNPMSLVGQKVDLIGAPVQAAGDGKVFWIGPSFDQKMLVVTDAATDMGGAVDGVKQAQRLNLTGEIKEFTDFANAKTKYKLDDAAVTFLTNKKVYLHADKAMMDKK